MAELAMVYITTDPQDNGAELRCTDHPEWWADADGTDLPSALRSATDHFRDEHRVHVDGCMCRGAQVIDQRCIPTARCPGSVVMGPSGTPAVCGSTQAHAAHDLNERVTAPKVSVAYEDRCPDNAPHLWVGRDGRPATGGDDDRCDACGARRGTDTGSQPQGGGS